MNKRLTAITLAAVLGIFVSHAAYARWAGGPGTGNGYGPGSCGNCNKMAVVDSEAKRAFLEETATMRTELVEKRSAYFALMNNSETPDKEEAQLLWSEMFDLQQQIQAKAIEAGMDPQEAPRGQFGYGPPANRGCRPAADVNAPCGCNNPGCPQTGDSAPAQQ